MFQISYKELENIKSIPVVMVCLCNNESLFLTFLTRKFVAFSILMVPSSLLSHVSMYNTSHFGLVEGNVRSDLKIATSSSMKPEPTTKKSLVPANSAHFLQENALLLSCNY